MHKLMRKHEAHMQKLCCVSVTCVIQLCKERDYVKDINNLRNSEHRLEKNTTTSQGTKVKVKNLKYL